MAKEGTFQLLGQPNPDVADINKGRIFWDTTSDTFKQIDENGIIKDLTSENPGGNNTNIQFNNLGTLGGSDSFVFDGTAVGIGTLTPDASAQLDLKTTKRGFLMPVMTTIQRDAITSPATGLEVYNINNFEPEFFNGIIWQSIGSSAGSNTIMGGISQIGGSLTKAASYGHTAAVEPPVMSEDGELTSLGVSVNGTLTGGSSTGRVTINGVAQTGNGETVTLTSTTGENESKFIVFSIPIQYLAGDKIGLDNATNSVTPTGLDLTIVARTRDVAVVPTITTNFAYRIDEPFPAEVVGLDSVKRVDFAPLIEIETSELFDATIDIITFDGVNFINNGPQPVDIDAGGSDTQMLFNSNDFQAGTEFITTDGIDLDFADNTKARFGTGNDLTIQHTGTETQIKNITGKLSILSEGGDDFVLTSGAADQIFKLGTIDGSTAARIQNGISTDLLIVDSAGKVGIGTATPVASSLLELSSTTTGFLMQRLTTTQRDAIPSPATGLEIYNLTNNEPEFFDGSAWITTGGTAPGGISPQVQFNNSGAFGGIAGVTSDGNNMDWANGARAQFGDSQELIIEHIGVSQIRNSTGELQVLQLDSENIVVRLGPTSSGNLVIQNAAASEVLRVTDFGEVGIGTSAPKTILHISEGPELITPQIGTLLFIENNSDDAFISIAGSNQTGIIFGDTVDSSDGSIIFDVIPSGFEIRTGGGLLAVSIDANQDMNFPDNNSAQFGAEADLVIFHNGTNSLIQNFTNTFLMLNSSAAGDLRMQNNSATGKVIAALGTSTNATSFEVHDVGDAALMKVAGDGEIEISKGPLITPSGTTGVSLAINTGTGSTGNGGDINLTAGDGLTNGGAIGLFAGAPTQTDTPGAGIEIAGGNGTGTGSGGPVELDGGTPLGTGAFGNVILQGDGGNVGIFTTAPDAKLTIVEEIHFPVLRTWTTQTSAADNSWDDVAFGNNTFVAISSTGTDRVMRSTDNGVTWVNISTPLDTIALNGVAFGNSTFVVVGPGNNNIMTSIDNGLNWVQKTSPSDNAWESVTFGNGLFVMVVGGGAEPKSAFSSDDGATWTLGQTSAGGGLENNSWNNVTFGDGTFVACANGGTNRVAHSTDGDLWTSATTTLTSPNTVTFGNGVFVMVDDSGPNDTIARSTDNGVSWSTIIPPTLNNWRSVAFGNGTFIAISTSGSGDRSISSIDLGLTWQDLTTPVDNIWRSIAFGNDNFVAVSSSGTANRVMTIIVTLIEPTAILDLQSTTSGFLPPRMTTTQRDLIPSPVAGLEAFNITSGLPNFHNGNLWKGLAPASDEVVYVNALSDFPTPVSGVITLAGGTTYKILNDVDLGSNQLLVVSGGTVIQGFNVSQTTLSGTSTVPMLQLNNFLNLRDIIVQQNGTGELLNSVAGLFSFNVLYFGGDLRFISGGVAIFNGGTIQLGARLIQDAAGGVTNLVFDLGFTFRDNAGTIDGLIEFETGSTTSSITYPGNGIFLTNANSIGIKINQGAAISNFDFDSSDLNVTNASSVMIELENPDDVLIGNLNNNNFVGAGTPFRCDPISSSNFMPDTLTNNQGIAIDDDGNLIIADPTAGTITRYVLLTNVVDIAISQPGILVRGVVWLKGDLYSSDISQNLIYRHAGFTTSVTSIAGAGAAANMLTTDGTNIIYTDANDDLVRVLDGFSTTVLFSFSTPAGANLNGIAFDGINLHVTDISADLVIVLKGITGTKQYSFPIASGATDFFDITVDTSGGFIGSDNADNSIYFYDHPVTFDHSAATWEIMDSLGIVASSDRGGSQFFIEDTTPIALPAFVQNVWQDVAATDIFYGSFNAMEKCRLFDETNGEIEWTGARERGRIIQAQFTVTRSDGGASDKFYEISVEVNGTIQKDSISIGVLPTTSTILTLTSVAITRDLVDGNPIKVQIRQTTTGVATTQVYSCRLSIN